MCRSLFGRVFEPRIFLFFCDPDLFSAAARGGVWFDTKPCDVSQVRCVRHSVGSELLLYKRADKEHTTAVVCRITYHPAARSGRKSVVAMYPSCLQLACVLSWKSRRTVQHVYVLITREPFSTFDALQRER